MPVLRPVADACLPLARPVVLWRPARTTQTPLHPLIFRFLFASRLLEASTTCLPTSSFLLPTSVTGQSPPLPVLPSFPLVASTVA